MKTANEFKELRDKKYDDWIEFDEKVKGQWKLIESIVDKETNTSLYKAMIDAKIRLGIARAGMRSISPNYQEINQYLDEVSELLSAR